MNDISTVITPERAALIKILLRGRLSGIVAPEEEAKRRKAQELDRQAMIRSLLSGIAKKAEDSKVSPSDAELRRMYDLVQADARLTKRIAGLGFGNTGDAYRRAALKLHILAIMNVLRDGKNIRNDIVHRPGYIPSEQTAARAMQEYASADRGISEFLQRQSDSQRQGASNIL